MNLLKGSAFVLAMVFSQPAPTALAAEHYPGYGCKADWLYRGQFGLSTHYFSVRAEDKEKVAEALDVSEVADQVAEAGASWLLFPLHHQSWIMNAPNDTLDRFVGNGNYTPSRDLPMELSDALRSKGIRLMLYINLHLDPKSACPQEVREAMGGWPPSDELIRNLAAVYREFSLRYGTRVAGWWVDAAGQSEFARAPQRDSWFASLAAALRAGNPDAIVAFNPGLRIIRYSTQDNYSAGEMNGLDVMPAARWLDGVQWHGWTYLGGFWASDGLRFDDDQLGRYVSEVTSAGGALTFDVGARGIEKIGTSGKPVRKREMGTIDPRQIEQIRRLMRYRRNARLNSVECLTSDPDSQLLGQ